MTFESAIHRAAVLVKSLPQAQAKKLLVCLQPEELQQVIGYARSMQSVTPEQKHQAIAYFVRETNLARSESTSFSAAEITPAIPFEFLNNADAAVIFDLLKNESPGDISVVLSSIDPALAADTLSHFAPNDRILILRKICRLTKLEDVAVRLVSQRIDKRLQKVLETEADQEDHGVISATRLLSCADPYTRSDLLNDLEEQDPEIVQRVSEQVFRFEDIGDWDDAVIKRLLPWVDTSLWAPALSSARPAVKRKVLGCFGERPRNLVRREIESQHPYDAFVIEQARCELVRSVFRLVDAGTISLPRGRGGQQNRAA